MEARHETVQIFTILLEFMLREFKVSYTMCASDTLEHHSKWIYRTLALLLEKVVHTYKVALVPAGKK